MKNNLNKNLITIIGAGPAGMSVAYYCNKNNIPFELFESDSNVGGNCRTFDFNGFKFDSGAHRFHDKDKQSTELVKSLLKKNLKLINVPSQIYINKKFVNFPLSPLNIIQFIGFFEFLKEAMKLISIRFKNNSIKNFYDFAIKQYGEKIAHMFLINYSEKLWGLPASELSTQISGNRLKGLDIKSLIFELFNMNQYRSSHLDGTFYYPLYGIGTIFENMKEEIGSEQFFLKNKITSIAHNKNLITSIDINNQQSKNINYLVSSLPINVIIRLLTPKAPKKIIDLADSIQFRELILVVFTIDKKNINKNGSMYFPSKDYIFTRIYEPKNRSSKMSPENQTSLVVEIPCKKNDDIWLSDKEIIIDEVKNQLIEIGFFKNIDIIDTTIQKIYNAYPILECDYIKKINYLNAYLSKFKNLIINGRSGKFKYEHIHDHIKEGENIVSKIKLKYN